jgi:excisionase family DNA binding protein
VDEELLTAAEIARRAGVYRSTVGDWIRDGKITAAGSLTSDSM